LHATRAAIGKGVSMRSLGAPALAFSMTLAMATPATAETTDGHLYVLAINGGGDKLDNFASHLGHLRQLV